MRSRDNQPGASPLLGLAGWPLFAIFAVLVLRYQYELLDYIEWADESETVLTAKLIARGATLYFDLFNHHGPLTFLPGLLVEQVGNFSVAAHRIPIMLGQWLALLALYFSPLMKDSPVARIYTAVVASALVLYWPELFGHMYKYQTIAGLMLVVILAQYSLPSISRPDLVTPGRIMLANLLIGALPFLAMTYLPIAILLFAAGLRRDYWVLATLCLLAGLALNLLFLGLIGSYAGYLAFHFHLNIAVLPAYIGGGNLWHMVDSIYRSWSLDLWRFMIFLVNTLALARLAGREGAIPWRTLSIGVALASLLLRAGDLPFHDMPYYYASLALPLLLLRRESGLRHGSAVVLGIFLIVCLIKLSLLVPDDRARLDARKIPKATEYSELARALTGREDRIIAYTFNAIDYLLADRLPASGNFFYFPWQKTYNENPVLGIHIDTCAEINRNRPKVILADKSHVLGRFPWESYAGCVQTILDEQYTQILHKPFYVRSDLPLHEFGLAASGESYTLEHSAPVTPDDRYALRLTDAHQGEIRRLGIALRGDPEAAALELTSPGDSVRTVRLAAPRQGEGLYWWPELPSLPAALEAVVRPQGGDATLLESEDAQGNRLTCLVYEYRDGRKRFTPGCPLH
ncbi:hypothetical protein [Stutzerimonas tarimensis]|uniref:Glycosyltransferase RgtA/B/C/D-like domain-containing protein n=1 Tax=Stutzerimonas tarimensis TaxID=1507735 RepID=A0ABV7T048_9GAMM